MYVCTYIPFFLPTYNLTSPASFPALVTLYLSAQNSPWHLASGRWESHGKFGQCRLLDEMGDMHFTFDAPPNESECCMYIYIT